MNKQSSRIIGALVAILLVPRLGFAQTYTLSPSPFLLAQSNTGAIINNACIWTYAAGTTNAVFTYQDNAGTQNSNPIRSDSAGRFTAYLIAGTSYKFVYETSCTPPAHGTTLRTADNVVGVPGSAATVDVTGTAGETISAGQVVYLSDGSGSKTAGQWFKADTANAYSSTTPEVGIAPSAIASAASGTIRLAGSVTGLSSLTVGAEYFVGSTGALTATASNKRHLGHADTATSLVLTGNPAPPTLANSIEDFRLTLSSGIPVTANDVTAATTLYCTPKTGNRIALFDSVGASSLYSSAEFSIAVPATTSTNYDVFAYNNAGVPTLELLAWRNSGQAITGATNATPIVITANAHGLSNGDEVYIAGVFGNTAANGTWTVANIAANTFELSGSVGNGAYTAATGYLNARTSTGKLVQTTTGAYTKTADLTRRYLGMIRTTTVSGQTEDSAAKRYVWNVYHQAPRAVQRNDATTQWNYTTATWRQANAAAANQVDVISGLAVSMLHLQLTATATNTVGGGGGVFINFGIGEDSTTTPVATAVGMINIQTAATIDSNVATLTKVPTVGRQFFVWLEGSVATGVTTWYGANNTLAAATTSSGLFGIWWN